jgi:tRNA dimethylallyltransferase
MMPDRAAARPRTPVVTIAGPTASGKSDLALRLAREYGGEIVSVDSAQVYRGMDVGSAKPDLRVRREVAHHLVDIVEPDRHYSAARFREDALASIDAIASRGRLPILAGGTMLYFRALRHGLSDLPQADPALRAELNARAGAVGWPALHRELEALDPVTAARLKTTDSQRIQRALEVCLLTGEPMSSRLGRREATFPYASVDLALVPADRAILHERIAARFDGMLAAGLVEELVALRERYALDPAMPSMRCVGYRAAWRYLEGEVDRDGLREQGIAATRQLAKRQLTWLRGEPHWTVFDSLDERVADRVRSFLDRALAAAAD